MKRYQNLHPTTQLNSHTRRARQVGHQRNAQVLQGDLPAALPEGPAGVDWPFLFVDPSNRQLMRHLRNRK